jgi:alkanesulfonate monooxygenase SsuD/methylene tetrahydromethanopterin reductase-like flavin-dependent oxidoreductase (luciferase family)
MRFGVFLLSQAPADVSAGEVLRSGLRQVALAEELGFDSVWLAEHHQTGYCVVSDALTYAAHVAAATSDIRIGIGVSVLPLHHPLEIVERATLVDIMSNGRLMLGAGRGYSATEFHTYGLDLPTRRDRFEEALDVVLKAWSGERFDHEGAFWTLRDVQLFPRPVQSPHPQVLIATSGTPETSARIAARGMPFIQGDEFLTPQIVADRIRTFRECAEVAGLSREATAALLADSWLSLKVHVASSTKEAKEQAGAYALWRFRKAYDLKPSMSGASLRTRLRERIPGAKALITDPRAKHWSEVTADDMAEFDLYGTPDDVIARIAEYRDAGVENIICSFDFGGMPEMMVRRSLKLFATEVAPPFCGGASLAAFGGRP